MRAPIDAAHDRPQRWRRMPAAIPTCRMVGAAVLLIAGCASRAEVMPDPADWVHATKPDSAFQHDAYVCHQDAVEYASGGGATIPFANLVRERQAECLEDRFGWTPADSASGG